MNDNYKTTESYQNFMKVNTGRGKLKIRAFAASEALPVGGLKIIVSTVINNEKIVNDFIDKSIDWENRNESLWTIHV